MPVPAPGQAAAPVPATLADEMNAWLDQPALTAVLDRFGAPSLSEGLDTVADWTSTHWNFRAGLERNFLEPSSISAEDDAFVVKAAEDLGLVTPQLPSLTEYDHVVILGGLVRACVWRTEYTKHLVDTGTAVRNVTAITGRRPIGGNETKLLETLGYPPLIDEAAVMHEALHRSFAPDGLTLVAESEPGTAVNSQWSVEVGSADDGPLVQFVMAPSSEPGARRANTPDSYKFWAEEVAKLGSGDTVLLVTSQIYMPFQHVDAVRMLGLRYGCRIETVGIDHRAIDDRGAGQPFSGVSYLQEINSILRSFRLLRDALLAA